MSSIHKLGEDGGGQNELGQQVSVSIEFGDAALFASYDQKFNSVTINGDMIQDRDIKTWSVTIVAEIYTEDGAKRRIEKLLQI